MAYMVTGASSGIGSGVAAALASQGQHVIATARNVERLQTLKSSYPDNIQIVTADLSTGSGRNTLIAVAKNLDQIDGLVHCAGSQVSPTSYHALETDKLNADFNVHVSAPIAINNALKTQLSGARIVYIDSYSASTVRVGWTGYSIVKAAAQMAARAAVEEMRDSTIIRVFPGAVQTPLVNAILTSSQPSATVTAFKEIEAKGEMSQPLEIGIFISNILTKATADDLKQRDSWNIGNPNDHYTD